MRVEVRRAWNVYAAVAASLATAGLAAAMVAAMVSACRVEPSPYTAASMLAAVTATLLAHEAVHVATARLLGVPGVRVRLYSRLAALIVDYDRMTLGQYVAVALAPQTLSIGLLLAAALLHSMGRVLEPLLLYTSALANIVGGVPDIMLSAYFGVVHRRAVGLSLLYDENGRVAGGVVEEPDRIVVYTF